MSEDQGQDLFREEADELLTELESTLLELEESPGDLALVNRVFRALHTIKGSGAMFGFDDIAHFTHDLENVFDKVRNEQLLVTKSLISTSFAARDHILGMLNGPDEKGNGTPANGAEILKQINMLMKSEAEAAPAVVTPAAPAAPVAQGEDEDQASSAPAAAVYSMRITPRGKDAGRELDLEPLFEELRDLGPCLVTPEYAAPGQSGKAPDAWTVELTAAVAEDSIRDLFLFTDYDLELDIQTAAETAPGAAAPDAGQDGVSTSGSGVGPGETPGDAPGEDAEEPDQPLERVPRLGEILIAEGVISTFELENALAQQKPIGQILSDSGLVSSHQVEQAVARQKQAEQSIADKHLASAARQQKEVGTSLRVAADKLDTLVDLVGELVIVQAQISQVVTDRSDPILTVLSEQLERLSSDLRDSTLGIRMLPIGSTFSKFRRLVRDLSSDLGKQIELVTRGEETELDKTVLERLGDPLVHLIRNSIDHGIDMPGERLAAGKPAQGLILLEAEHSGSEVLIRITDDGKGMNPEAIRSKAVERGLISPEAELTDQEALKLIFLPGFSTAEKVTSISGRGVGMDVVQRAIDALRGSIEIKSVRGQGTTITIHLPLTLAIIEGLQVQVADGFFVIPLSLVEECVELYNKDMDPARKQQIIQLRGELVPYIPLRRWFEIPGDPPDIEQIVIAGVEGKRIGIVVDKVIGEHQTVIKSLGRVYKDVEGISGATIKGDGTLALILDVPRLVRAVVAELAH